MKKLSIHLVFKVELILSKKVNHKLLLKFEENQGRTIFYTKISTISEKISKQFSFVFLRSLTLVQLSAGCLFFKCKGMLLIM